MEPAVLRRHPLRTAGRLAQLARIGFKHPRSRLHVLEFDRGHDSDGLVASLEAAHGMPLLLSDQLRVLGGSIAQAGVAPMVVGGRRLRPCVPAAGAIWIDSEPWVDPDIAFDVRIAEKSLRHVGFLAPSEMHLATAILRQSVDDVAVDVDGNAGTRALRSAGVLQSVTGRPASVTVSACGEPRYAVAAGAWSVGSARVLADLWAQLLFGERCVLRHLTQRTIVPSADGIALTCHDSLRQVPESAVSAGRSLLAAGRGDARALNALISHLRESSGGADSAASYGEAARRVVARVGETLLPSAAPRPACAVTGDIPELPEPFATCLVIGHIVYLARVLDAVSRSHQIGVAR